jgi:hypothetical protein
MIHAVQGLEGDPNPQEQVRREHFEAYGHFCVDTIKTLALMCKTIPLDLQQVVADLIYHPNFYGIGEPSILALPGSSNTMLQISLLERARKLKNVAAKIECDVEHMKEIGDELRSHAEYS